MSLQVPYNLDQPFSVHKITTGDQVIHVFKFPEEAALELAAIRDYGFARREIWAYTTELERDNQYVALNT